MKNSYSICFGKENREKIWRVELYTIPATVEMAYKSIVQVFSGVEYSYL
jgi:hypothetical protein